MYHIKYKNQGKIERTGEIESLREAIQTGLKVEYIEEDQIEEREG